MSEPLRKYAGTACLCLALFYIWCISPASGVWGGLLFIITGWIVPTIVNLTATLAIVGARRLRRPLGIACFTGVSLALAVVPSSSALINLAHYRTNPTTSISQVVDLKNASWLQMCTAGIKPAFPFPLESRVAVAFQTSGNSSLFYPNPTATIEHVVVKHLLSFFGNRPGGLNTAPLANQPEEACKFRLTISLQEGDKSSLSFEVLEGGKQTAVFRQENLPRRIFETPFPDGIGAGLDSDKFAEYAGDMLIRGSFWTVLARFLGLSYFPERTFDQFLDSAIHR